MQHCHMLYRAALCHAVQASVLRRREAQLLLQAQSLRRGMDTLQQAAADAAARTRQQQQPEQGRQQEQQQREATAAAEGTLQRISRMQQQQLQQQGATALQAAATATDLVAGCPSPPVVHHPIVLVDPSCESPCSSVPEDGPGDSE